MTSTSFGWFDPTEQIVQVAAGWFPQAQSAAQRLYGTLFVLELFMFGLQTILFRDNLGEFFSGLTFKIFTMGFFMWLITDAADIFTAIIGGFYQAGMLVSGTSHDTLKTLYSTEGGVVTIFLADMVLALVGASTAESICPAGSSGCVSAISTIAQPLAWVSGAMALLMFSSLLVLSLTYILITIETVIVMCGGVFFIGFAGLRFTAPYSQGYFRYAVNVGTKLFAFWLVVSLEAQLVPGVLNNAGLVSGATVGSAITAALTSVGTDAVTTATTEESTKETARDTAVAAALGAEVATETAAGGGVAAASFTTLGTGDPGAGDPVLASAPGAALEAEATAHAGADAASDTAATAAGAATAAAQTVALTAAVTAAITAIIFAAFGTLQVIVLNALSSLVPTLAASLTNGSSMFSAQEMLKGTGATFADVGISMGTLSSKINSVVSAMSKSPAQITDQARRQESADSMTAPRPPSEEAQQEEQPEVLTLPPRPDDVQQAGGRQHAGASASGRQPTGASAAGRQPAGTPAAGQQTSSEQSLRQRSEDFGLAGLTNSERDALSPLMRAKLVADMVEGKSALTPDVRKWMNRNPDCQEMWKTFHRHKRVNAESQGANTGFRGMLLLEALNATTHEGKDKEVPALGDSGMPK